MDTTDKKLITFFDRLYSPEKMAEGRAVLLAFFSGACDSCPYLSKCSMDNHFTFPDNAACMKEKAKLLREE